MLKRFFKNRWVKTILILHGVALVVLIALFFYMRHITIVEYEQAIDDTPYDAIIVPGYPFKDSTWHDIMKARVHWSRYLFEQGHAKNIIYSGSAVYTPFVEARIMRTYGKALGLPADNLFAETEAEHSTENLYYSYQIAKAKGFKKIALATDPVQSFFLMRFASERALDVDYIPIQFDLLKKLNLADPNIDPSSAFVDNFVSLPERQGFIERFRGTLGHNIKSKTVQ